MSTKRIFNFSAGPATLPLAVLEEAQRDLLALPGVGMSVLEISHRSKTFDDIIERVEADLRELAGISNDYRILFLQGGASLQFSMVPMNLLPAGKVADYIVTGVWADKAASEARKVGEVHVAASGEAESFRRLPKDTELSLSPAPAYVHMTSNNTIYGTQWHRDPDVGSRPLVCDASSDIFCRPTDFSRYVLVYAGAQKNLSIAGLTLVVLRNEVVAAAPKNLAAMLSYATLAKDKSLHNTPPVFPIYMLGLVLKWIRGLGGLPAVAERNRRKAGKLYAEIDRTGFYRGHAELDSRSLMNVTFRLPNEALDDKFASEATAAGFDGLKGHRSVGGMRASIYNAFPEEGIDALVSFMREFERKNG